jgi:hypothetical protein
MNAEINDVLGKFRSLAEKHLSSNYDSIAPNKKQSHILQFNGGNYLEFGANQLAELYENYSSYEDSEVDITNIPSSKLIRKKMIDEGKIGPRIKDVVEEILDLNWMFETVSQQFLCKLLVIPSQKFHKLPKHRPARAWIDQPQIHI